MIHRWAWLCLALVPLLPAASRSAQSAGITYDLVLTGGRVIDPANHMDEVRNVAISGGKIAAVSTGPLAGKQTIDVTNLVVAPGFVDLHSHGQNNVSQSLQVRDGVTTALELEIGIFPMTALGARDGRALINFGYSAGHTAARMAAKRGDLKATSQEPLTPGEQKEMLGYLTMALDDGALGIGIGLDYLSAAVTPDELEAVFRLAARRKVPVFIHIRMPEDPTDVSGFREVLELAERSGASVHMAHLVSTGLGRVTVFLRMLDEARARGVDVTTEVYPYTAGVTEIGSRILDGDWQRRLGVGYGHVEVLATGQRFTGQAMWDEYRARRHSEQIVIHAMREEWVEQALRHPGVMVASDALFIRRTDERSHPRNAGTFSRVLGRYFRERGVLTLSDAIARMTWLPARRLETVSPAMRGKGRLGLGADADIAVFDAGRIIDQATFVDSSRYSAGIVHVLVGGTAVVRDGELVKGVFSGRAVRAGAKPGG